MKTYLITTKRFRAVSLLFGVCMLLMSGCKQVNSPFEDTSENGQTIEGLNINVKYAESYDQTEITYSRIWPEGISAGLQKDASSSGGELLVDYEKTKEVIAFDEEGYISTVTEFLEGDGEMNMPEAAYEQLKGTMPARSADYDPVVKTVMQDGKTFLYGRSGNLKYQYDYDPEIFRATQAELDSMEAWLNSSDDIEQSVQRNLLNLSQQDIVFERIGDYYASYRIESGADEKKRGIASYQYVDDLRTGLTVQLVVLRTDGKYDSIVSSMYQTVNKSPILASEIRYIFTEVNGKWDIAYRQITTRENIKVVRN